MSRSSLGMLVPGHGHRWNAFVVSTAMVWSICVVWGGGCPVSGFPPAGLSLAVLTSWLVLNVFSFRQCCEEPGRVFVWIVPAMMFSCSRGLPKYSQAL